jgi:hypothetical protein
MKGDMELADVGDHIVWNPDEGDGAVDRRVS